MAFVRLRFAAQNTADGEHKRSFLVNGANDRRVSVPWSG